MLGEIRLARAIFLLFMWQASGFRQRTMAAPGHSTLLYGRASDFFCYATSSSPRCRCSGVDLAGGRGRRTWGSFVTAAVIDRGPVDRQTGSHKDLNGSASAPNGTFPSCARAASCRAWCAADPGSNWHVEQVPARGAPPKRAAPLVGTRHAVTSLGHDPNIGFAISSPRVVVLLRRRSGAAMITSSPCSAAGLRHVLRGICRNR